MRKNVLAVLLALALTLSGCALGQQEIQAPARSVAADGKLTIPMYQSHSGWIWLEEHKVAKYGSYAGAGVASVGASLLFLLAVFATYGFPVGLTGT